MQLYSRWLAESLEGFATVRRTQAPGVFLSRLTNSSSIAKYCFYLDQFVLLPIALFFWQIRFDAIIVGDHSNGPSALLVSSKKLIVMVHDSIAIRGAFGLIPNYEHRVGKLGILLQRLIVLSLRKSGALFSNPGPLVSELRELGVTGHIEVLGCPLDISRLTKQKSTPPSHLSASDKFALYVGSDARRKRKSLLVDIWRSELLSQRGYKLVLAGFTSQQDKKQFEKLLPDRIVCVNDVTEGELRWLYENCSCMITASAHEGFCIPVLEALYFDKCVITPNADFFQDVFGSSVDAILEFDGHDAPRIVQAIEERDPSRSQASRNELLARYSFLTFTESVRRVISTMMKYQTSCKSSSLYFS
ncbi:glycosyltransferase [Bradyrhizobium yuanmingense]|uniref:glycosyltransferase n=1 Tax=Bradyrhizobium yuanmingense TaxID=108015 RepID=UPI0005612C2C|nr:glycosyltransferase [Bradyrhizobium yuanmingense]